MWLLPPQPTSPSLTRTEADRARNAAISSLRFRQRLPLPLELMSCAGWPRPTHQIPCGIRHGPTLT